MRAAPALQLTLRRFGAWRAAVAALCGVAAAALAAWLGAGGWAGAAGLAGVVASWFGSRRAPTCLAWDGEAWRAGPADADVDELPRIEPRVMIDLGGFLLLRCERADSGVAEWLPLQQRGLEASWHALRCALYSPRPAAASALPDDLSPPA